MLEIILAALGIIIGTAISEEQMKRANERQARETDIRRMYQVIQNRYGITVNQLDSYLSQIGIQLDRLVTSAQGSARLSDATQKMLALQREYPDINRRVNLTKQEIQKQIDKLSQQADSDAKTVEQSGKVSNSDIYNRLTKSILDTNNVLENSGIPLNGKGDNTLDVKDLPQPETDEESGGNADYLQWIGDNTLAPGTVGVAGGQRKK